MRLRSKEIAKLVGCSSSTLLTYIGHSDFAHIYKDGHYYVGITEDDIEKFKNKIKYRKEKPYGGYYYG